MACTRSIDCQKVQDPACPTLQFPSSDTLPRFLRRNMPPCLRSRVCIYIQYLSYSIKCVLACVSAYLPHGCPMLSPPTAPLPALFLPPSFFLWHPVGTFSVYHRLIGRMTWRRTTDPSGTSPFRDYWGCDVKDGRLASRLVDAASRNDERFK